MAETTKKTTQKGPHGGGNKYQQMKLKADFVVIDNKPKTKKESKK